MGLLDSLLQGGALDDLTALVKENPRIIEAATSLLNPKDSSVGDGFGVDDLLGSLNGGGLGDVVSSWLGSGSNQAIGADQLGSILGSGVLEQFAAKAGVGADQAGSVLAGVLPELINQLSPKGQAPDAGNLGSLLGGVLSGLRN